MSRVFFFFTNRFQAKMCVPSGLSFGGGGEGCWVKWEKLGDTI